MDDKIIMNAALTMTKNACDIMMHGAIESNNALALRNVHKRNSTIHLAFLIF